MYSDGVLSKPVETKSNVDRASMPFSIQPEAPYLPNWVDSCKKLKFKLYGSRASVNIPLVKQKFWYTCKFLIYSGYMVLYDKRLIYRRKNLIHQKVQVAFPFGVSLVDSPSEKLSLIT